MPWPHFISFVYDIKVKTTRLQETEMGCILLHVVLSNAQIYPVLSLAAAWFWDSLHVWTWPQNFSCSLCSQKNAQRLPLLYNPAYVNLAGCKGRHSHLFITFLVTKKVAPSRHPVTTLISGLQSSKCNLFKNKIFKTKSTFNREFTDDICSTVFLQIAYLWDEAKIS